MLQRLDYRIDDFYAKTLFGYAHGLQHFLVFSEGLPKRHMEKDHQKARATKKDGPPGIILGGSNTRYSITEAV